MHFAISTTCGQRDTTRAVIPFIFAATVVENGVSVTVMMFHVAVSIAVPGTYENMVPCGPPARFAEVFAHPKAEIIVCKPCAEVRGISEEKLIKTTRMGGMADLYARIAEDNCKSVAF